jgi:hypothetical protein
VAISHPPACSCVRSQTVAPGRGQSPSAHQWHRGSGATGRPPRTHSCCGLCSCVRSQMRAQPVAPAVTHPTISPSPIYGYRRHALPPRSTVVSGRPWCRKPLKKRNPWTKNKKILGRPWIGHKIRRTVPPPSPWGRHVRPPAARPQPARSSPSRVFSKKKKKKKKPSGWRPKLPCSITSFFERATPEEAAELAAERMDGADGWRTRFLPEVQGGAGLGHKRCLNWRQLEQAALVGVWDDVFASEEWSRV